MFISNGYFLPLLFHDVRYRCSADPVLHARIALWNRISVANWSGRMDSNFCAPALPQGK